MGTDEEIRQGRALLSAPSPVLDETLACQERRFPRDRATLEHGFRNSRIHILDAVKPDRDLGVDNRVDHQDVFAHMSAQTCRRPAFAAASGQGGDALSA